MSNQTTNPPDHDEIMSLLPWFVNQTLGEHERISVLSHIKNCDDCQREIQFLESLEETVKSDAETSYSTHADVDKDLAGVMNRIDAKSHPSSTVKSGVSWFRQTLDEFFRFTTAPTLSQWGVSALAGILVAVLGFQMFYGQSDNNYSVLSSPDINDSSMRLSVETSTSVSQEQVLSNIEHALEKIVQQVDIEIKEDGMYTIVFRESVGVAELSKIVVDLENDEQINRVEILP